MAAEKKVDRLNHIIQREVSQIIQQEMKDTKVGFVTITDVNLTNDLSLATIYVNFLGADSRNEAGLAVLNKSKGFIKTLLSKRLTIRKVPELQFKIDDSMEKGRKIDNILKQINDK
ncbi:30S ribosome-binding factor RbfA [Mycoplasma sp. P36-A1]|uniref:30S ribosome-binding factor RbfA n=1 Tax=Mycoplasma sp. P36-A1 TaxID=3252900 RepID=UPI003C2E275C